LKTAFQWKNYPIKQILYLYLRRIGQSFLWQLFKDTVDFSVDMFDKLANKIYNAAQHDVDNHNKSQRKNIRESWDILRCPSKLPKGFGLFSGDFRVETRHTLSLQI